MTLVGFIKEVQERMKMKELHEVKNFEMTSHSYNSGDLKMVKVRRGKRGHRRSRSLVFRISRTPKPISDDSGIKCSSTEDHSSTEEQSVSPHSLKIKIPKAHLPAGIEKNKTIARDSDTSNSVLQVNQYHESPHETILNTERDIPDTCKNNLNLNADILSANSDILNTIVKQDSSGFNKTSSGDLRRSSRRILLRVQKDHSSELSVKETFNENLRFPFVPSSSNEQQGALEVKKKRGRKPGVKLSELKKRKGGRRGRPPKSQFPKQLSLVKPANCDGDQNEKLMLVPPKNSVWTLVPKELFESEFFKSHLRKVRFSNPAPSGMQKQFTAPLSFVSPAVPISATQTSETMPFKFPTMSVNDAPAIQRIPDERDFKRPTVIYFDKKKIIDSQDHRRELKNQRLLFKNEVSKTQNDLLYLFNKYRMLEDIILKNYYELAGGNLNKAENMLSNFLSSSPICSKKVPNLFDSQANSTIFSILDGNLNEQMPHPAASCDTQSSKSAFDDIDILTRKMIVQSLEVLYNEEAVLA